MQRNHYIKLASASVCALSLWVGATTMAATTASADEGKPSTTAATTENSGEPDSSPYTVRAGDYLEAIAQDNDINWPSIYEVNPEITNPDLIYPNQKLDIPQEDVPLTRSIAGITLDVSEQYQPQAAAPTQRSQAKSTKTKAKTQGYAGQKSPTKMTAAGVPGLAQVIGRPYVYGGTSLSGFDCSGLTMYLASIRGIELPRTAMSQYQATRRIGLADLQPGDLVFFNPGHVGMYIGGNQVVHATNPAQGVRVDNLQSAINYNGYMGSGALGR